MKKLMILATCAAIAAVACTKIHEVTPVTQGPEIGLGTWTNTLTKAYTNTWANNDAFSVFATKTVGGTTSSVFEDTKVTYDGSKWGYTPLKYWDVTASNYTFYAFLPFNGTGEQNGYLAAGTYASTGEFQTATITFSNPAGNDQDILVATEYSRDKGAAASLSTANVDLEFNHMTSLVDVYAKIDNSLKSLAATAGQSVKVTVTALKLDDILYSGTFAVNGYDATTHKPTYDDTTYPYGWNATATTHDYDVITTSPVVVYTEVAPASGAATTYDATDGSFVSTSGDPAALFTDYILMPQDLTNGQQLLLSYTIDVVTTSTGAVVSTATYTDVPVLLKDFIRTDIVNNTSGTAITGWLPGYHYTYYLTLAAKPIVFGTVTVNNWSTDTGYYYLVR